MVDRFRSTLYGLSCKGGAKLSLTEAIAGSAARFGGRRAGFTQNESRRPRNGGARNGNAIGSNPVGSALGENPTNAGSADPIVQQSGPFEAQRISQLQLMPLTRLSPRTGHGRLEGERC